MPSKGHRQISLLVRLALVICGLLNGGASSFAGAAEQHIMPSRVPADKLTEARALISPFADSSEMRAKGKALYEGKGTCLNCHGQSGGGDGPLAASLNPAPRNFHHHGFWRHRMDGELFWVIKYGVPGTAMIGFGGQLNDEEIWALIQYERGFSGGHGHHGGMGAQHERRKSDAGDCCAGQELTR